MNNFDNGVKGGKIVELRREVRLRDNPVVNFHGLHFVELRKVFSCWRLVRRKLSKLSLRRNFL